MSLEDKQTARIRVLVRCRPPIRTEESKQCNRILVNSEANAIVVRDELSTWGSDARQFDFDRVFDIHQSQSVVFDEVRPLISHVLNGFHATIFAYGQTGSGKTYTMEGLNYRLVPAEPSVLRTLPSTTTSTKKAQQASESSLSLSSSMLSSSIASTSELPSSAGNHVQLHKSQPSQCEWESSVGVEADVAHTPVEQHGIVPRMIQLLFDEARCREQQDNAEKEKEEWENKEMSKTSTHECVRVKYSFKCSYYQIYNEKITDLLRPSPVRSWQHQQQQKQYYNSQYYRFRSQSEQGHHSRYVNADNDGLRLRWHDGDKFTVENLFQCECNDACTMRRVFFSGVQEKVMSSHSMNWQSSRSHCVFTIYVCCSNALNNEIISHSELSLVDLAGSEKLRQMSSQPSSRLLRESIEINTSLLTLGKVITALATNSNIINNNSPRSINSANSNYSGKPEKRPMSRSSLPLNNTWHGSKVVHVPYRESKLTKLLKHALGGNSLTVMIACINPCDEYVEETLSTLLYAGKARRITNVLHLNEEPTRALLQQLRAEIAQLKTELAYYRTLAQHTVAQETTEVHEIKEKAQKSHTELKEELLEEQKSEEYNQQHLEQKPKTMHKIVEQSKKHNGYQIGSKDHNSSEEKEEFQKETNQLADALISACEMLQKIISVNKELREAYDIVKQSNHEALRREAELNAENITLRERVSTLEQIALNNTFVSQSIVSEAAVSKMAEPHNAIAASATPPATTILEATKPAVVTLTSSSSESFLKSARSASPALSSLEFVRLQHNDGREQIGSPDVNVLPALHEHLTDNDNDHGNSCNKKENMDTNAELEMPERSVKQVHTKLGEVEKTNNAQEKLINSAESTSMTLSNEANGISTSLHSELSLPSAGHKSHHKAKHKENENHMHTSLSKGSNKTKHVSRLSNLLEAYMTKYKHPTKSANYEEYYQLEARKLAQSSPAQETMERVNELLRTTSVECDVQTLIPQSMLRTRTFGKLAFGGANDERDVFEQKRAEREERRQALLQRQQELYTAVHENIHGHTNATKDSVNNKSSFYNTVYDRSNRHVSVKRNGTSRCENIDQKQFAKTMELPRVRCAEDNTVSTPHRRSTQQLRSACITDSINHAHVHTAQTPMLTKTKELLYENDDDESIETKYLNGNQCNNVNFKSNRYDTNIKRTEQLSQGNHNNKKDSNANHVAQLLRYLNQDKY